MANRRPKSAVRAFVLGTTLITLAGCQTFDIDLRPKGLSTASAVRQATAPRPPADERGVISYPNYQVAVARRGDTVADVANRIGLDPTELARYNGIDPGVPLRKGEILALPRRVGESATTASGITTGPIQPSEKIDITTLANNAIGQSGRPAKPAKTPAGTLPSPEGLEPIRHRVERGETAYSISRLYNVSVRSLAEWNGLGPDLSVREGQYLLIPVAKDSQPKDPNAPRRVAVPLPGVGSPTPTPPSAAKPLPSENPKPATRKPVPASPNLGGQRTAASGKARLASPAEGKIIRAFVKKKNEGIDIAAPAGSPVRAAEAGTVAAITQDTDQVPILVIRHAGNLLTVYANVSGITVKKGDKVKRGQKIAVVRSGDPSFVHFEVRKGFDAVDPVPYLN